MLSFSLEAALKPIEKVLFLLFSEYTNDLIADMYLDTGNANGCYNATTYRKKFLYKPLLICQQCLHIKHCLLCTQKQPPLKM